VSLPYRWVPDGADRHMLIDKIEPGMILARDHAVYRVIEKHPKPEDETFPWRIILRPIAITGDDPRDRDHDQPFKVRAGLRYYTFADEHYPLCAKCLEPLPCREQMAEQVAASTAKTLDLYSEAGVCPSCSERVTPRQDSITWQENIVNPFGPPVTFHLRRKCHWDAVGYERSWWEQDRHRPRTLYCPGSVIEHYDGRSECSTDGCPGSNAYHPSSVHHYPRYSDCPCVAASPAEKVEAEPTEPLFSTEEVQRIQGDRP
jgi:hypothetical protein